MDNNTLTVEFKIIPVVSICAQTFNQGNYIRKCLESLVSQDSSYSYQLLLGEDDSKDATREICIEYANKFTDRIKLFLHDRKNVIYIDGKPTGRYNFLNNLSHATGKYIAFCEGDDYWIDHYKLQKQVDFLEANPRFSICFSPVHIVDQRGNLKEISNQDTPSETTYKDLLKGNYLNTPSVMIRRDALPNPLPEWLKKMPMGDWPLLLLASLNGDIKMLNEPLAAYRIHDKGVWSTHTSFQKLLVGFKSRRILLKGLPPQTHHILLNSIVGNALYISSHYKDNGKSVLALKYFLLYLYYRALKWFNVNGRKG